MNKSLFKKNFKGFTLIELLVVIAIIGLLSSMSVYAINVARVKSRDTRRMADLKQIATALELYYDDHGYYPKESEGSNGRVGEGAGLDTMLSPYLKTPNDPLGPGNGTYYYYYDGQQNCVNSGVTDRVAVIFANTMETVSGNRSDYCESWGGEGGAGNINAYHIVMGASN
jgi:general secretion pathway protein G